MEPLMPASAANLSPWNFIPEGSAQNPQSEISEAALQHGTATPEQKASWLKKVTAGMKNMFQKMPAKFQREKTKDMKENVRKKENGNAFTAILPSAQNTVRSEENLIANIIAQSGSAEGENTMGLKSDAKELLADEDSKKRSAEEHLQLAKIIFGSSFLIPLTSLFFSLMFVNPQSFLASFAGNRNYGVLAQEKAAAAERLTADIARKKTEISGFIQKIADIQENKALNHIVAHRIGWQDVFAEINAIADRTFEGNKISRYVTFQGYSGKITEKNTITVQGQVRDPLGKSWAALIKFKDALNADENFSGVVINQFSKQPASTNARITTSEYISPFSFQFDYWTQGKPDPNGKAAPKEAAAPLAAQK